VSSAAPIRVVDLAGAPAPVRPPVAVLRRMFEPAPAGPATAHHQPRPSRVDPGVSAAPPLPGALRDIEGMRARLDGMLAQARRGRTFSPQELLCLQADSHRFAQTVELAARAVEHGVQGLRQALNAQV
jgi:hypothetical protein